MFPSCGLFHSWGVIFISPDSVVRPENPQTAGCCSFTPSRPEAPLGHSPILLGVSTILSRLHLQQLRSAPKESCITQNSLAGLSSVNCVSRIPGQPVQNSMIRTHERLAELVRFQTPERAVPALPTKRPRPGFCPQPGHKFHFYGIKTRKYSRPCRRS